MTTNKRKAGSIALNSAVATSIAEVMTLPICTIKTVYQNSAEKRWLCTVKYIWNRGGLLSFYSSTVPAVASQVSSSSLKYTMYRAFQENLPGNPLIHGMATGFVASMITHPCDVCRSHIQVDKSLVSMMKEKGILVLYSGWTKTLLKSMAGATTFVPIFDLLSERMCTPLAAVVSGLISSTLVQPLDYMKTRQMVGNSPYESWNIRKYYKGLSLNMLRLVPHFTITMVCMEAINKKGLL